MEPYTPPCSLTLHRTRKAVVSWIFFAVLRELIPPPPSPGRPSIVWKQLLGQPLDLRDLDAIDYSTANDIMDMQQVGAVGGR